MSFRAACDHFVRFEGGSTLALVASKSYFYIQNIAPDVSKPVGESTT